MTPAARRAPFSTFSVGVRGSASTTSTYRGSMCRAMRSAQNLVRSTASGDHGHHHVVLGQLAGNAERCRVEHVGVQLHDLLHLERRDVLAPAADRVGHPAHEEHVADGVAPHEIAGVEPEVAAGEGARLRESVIPVGDQRRLPGSHHQLADGVGTDRLIVAVDHLDVVRRDGPPARAGHPRLVEGLVDRQADVGRAVQLHELQAEAGLERLGELGDGHPPGQAHPVVGVVGGRWPLVQHRQRGAHEVEDGGARRPDVVPEAGDGEPFGDDRRGAQHERGQHGEDRRVEMEEGERAVEDVVGPQLQVLHHQLRLAHGISMRQHTALRRPGRSRREQHQRRVGHDMRGGGQGDRHE